MAGETTYYRRLQVLLELSAVHKPRSAALLIDHIAEKSPPNFVYHRWNPDKRDIVGRCSVAAIKKTFGIASELGLVDSSTGILTKIGKEAADPARFERLLRQQLTLLLGRLGCTVSSIVEMSRQLLHSRKITLPTADELYARLFTAKENNLPAGKFRTLLRLLAACGGIATSRRQVFLPPE